MAEMERSGEGLYITKLYFFKIANSIKEHSKVINSNNKTEYLAIRKRQLIMFRIIHKDYFVIHLFM